MIHTAVTTHFGNMQVYRFFFGLDDLSNENKFRWADGTLLSETGYSTWIESNPDNYEGYEHCVERIHNGGWNDRYCSDRKRFVCEKPEVPPLHLIAMTSTPFGSPGNAPTFSCVLSPDNTQNTITYTERVVRPSLTPGGYTLNVPGSEVTLNGGLTQNLPDEVTAVGVYKCSTTSTITGTSTSADVTILLQERHFQPSDGRLTKTVYPGDDITLSVSTTDSYESGTAEIRWSTFSNFAEGSLSPSGDGDLTYTIRSASKRNADVYGTFENNAVDNRLYSLIRVIVSECPRGRWNLPLCDRLCDNCLNGGICHPQSGTCICPPGFMGKNCLTACGKHRFGWECEIECGDGKVLDACSGSQICLPDPYGCNCLSGYTGIYCNKQCTQESSVLTAFNTVTVLEGYHVMLSLEDVKEAARMVGQEKAVKVCSVVPPVCPVGYSGINCTEFCNCPDLSECEKDSGFCTSSEGQCEIGFVAETPEKPDRCAASSDDGFAYVSLPPQRTFVLPIFNSQPRLAEQGYNHLVIAWDSWNPGVDVGDGPVIGYKVYVSSSDGNDTNTFITASGVPSERPGSVASRKRRGYEGSMKSSYEVFTTVRKERDGRQMKHLRVETLPRDSSRKKRQGDTEILMHNITDLDKGQTYEIRISAVREGLNGEGEMGPALSVTTREIPVEPPIGSSTIGPIVGGAIGGIIILLLIAGLVIIIKIRRNRTKEVSKPVTYKNDGFIEGISTDKGQETDQPSQRYENLGRRKPMEPSNQIIMPDLPTRPTPLDEGHKPTRIKVEESSKDRRLIPVSKFANFVENNRHTDTFYKDFLNLANVCPGPPASMIRTALKKENRSKSRNTNNHPLDRNRVILESVGSLDSDFIDASYVKGIRYRFITTQMPMPNTVADFWDVVFYNQPTVIIMLNDDDRRNKSFAQYWLDSGVATFGSFSVTTVSVSENEGLIEREMQVTRNNSKARHVVKQYQFLHWPNEAEQQANRARQLINLMTKVQETLERFREGFPVLVHCMNGVGRTGVFCSTLECIAQVNEEGAVDVFHVVKMLRSERMHFVQTEEEYSFIYELIKEYLQENEYEDPLPEVSPNDHTYTYAESPLAPGSGESEHVYAELQEGAPDKGVYTPLKTER
nr:uncharacterized protein LOC129282680 [Lytechinus pictus]